MSAATKRGHTATKTPKSRLHRAIAYSVHLVVFVAGVIVQREIGGVHLDVVRCAPDPTIAYLLHLAGNCGKCSGCAETD